MTNEETIIQRIQDELLGIELDQLTHAESKIAVLVGCHYSTETHEICRERLPSGLINQDAALVTRVAIRNAKTLACDRSQG